MSIPSFNSIVVSIRDINVLSLLEDICEELEIKVITITKPTDRKICNGDLFSYQECCIILDAETFTEAEDDIKSYLAETDCTRPILFIGGGWSPKFYHRSLIDITGLNKEQMTNFLSSIRSYYYYGETDIHPIVLYPSHHQQFLDPIVYDYDRNAHDEDSEYVD